MSEVEETFKRISSHKGVLGSIIVNGDGIPIRTTLDNTTSVQYAALMSTLVSKARTIVKGFNKHDQNPATARVKGDGASSKKAAAAQNDLTFLRIRSKKHEIMVAPDGGFILIVIQNPSGD
ncbi:hypothetical protein CBR_g34671 [Chara braunii]|uniref:Roadblock/LAMTOR2 domain-containing protein n=1 Tax=Chara braunii TaxID=69332 RepID=A0A388JYT0_CHABU|nr:hypothetical protein CBR_g34671 [Chara braunii]|eukprot:GBG62971.1 hypothetical protein CBR_g34671 [Chara braunii]